jgi:hypothetical protein
MIPRERLTTFKRDQYRREYEGECARWAKHFRVPPPVVVVRRRHAGGYRMILRRISLPPGSERSSLVHEFAHHLASILYDARGHGAEFRIALVQVATVAYGRADLYPWRSEYSLIARWAERHGLIRP